MSAAAGPENRTISIFDLASGERLWTIPAPFRSDNGCVHFARTGLLAYVQRAVAGDHNAVVETQSGKMIRSSPYDTVGAASAFAVSSDGQMTFGWNYPRQNRAWSVFRALDLASMPSAPVCTVTFDVFISGMQRAEFSLDDQRIAWGGPNGEILIAHIPAIIESLLDRGLNMPAHSTDPR